MTPGKSLGEALAAARRAEDPGPLIAAIPYAVTLGIGARLEAGALVTRLPFRRGLVGNPFLPALHGGVVGAFLELTAALDLLWRQEGATPPRSVTMSVDFLRSAGPRDSFARAHVARLGRRVASLRVEAWQDDPARPIAQAHAHMLLTAPEGDGTGT